MLYVRTHDKQHDHMIYYIVHASDLFSITNHLLSPLKKDLMLLSLFYYFIIHQTLNEAIPTPMGNRLCNAPPSAHFFLAHQQFHPLCPLIQHYPATVQNT